MTTNAPVLNQVFPVILCGGSGTRLWPLSREELPKQLLQLHSDDSLLQQTLKRVATLPAAAAPIIVSNERHRFLIAAQAHEAVPDRPPLSILLEPCGRNTAPALTLAALAAQAEDPEAIMLVLPSDQLIRDCAAFVRAAQIAINAARQAAIVTFGIIPDHPHTGYGYLATELSGDLRPLLGFVEKPELARAQALLQEGRHLWNSGMFCLSAATWLKAIAQLAPEIYTACLKTWHSRHQDMDFIRFNAEAFRASPADSIDCAVMEKLSELPYTQKAYVVPLAAGWSDLGAWAQVAAEFPADAAGNRLRGDVLLSAARDNFVIADKRLVALVGVSGLTVIETADAILIAQTDCAQNVRDIVKQLQEKKRSEHISHRRVYRPWGYYEGVDDGTRFQVKHLQVSPGASLSLQMHHHRAEHWVVVRGTAEVTRGDEVFLVSENESTYIPLGTKHRLRNPGKLPLEIIEVQSGAYLQEDDIVRFADHYGREQNHDSKS